jgi:Lar family restriction alleviation protein
VNQMNYNERLMPCPFCGGKANMITTTNGSTHHDVSFTFGIECSECGTSLPWVHELRATLENGELKITKDERDRAVEEWNRRMPKKKSEEE